MAHRSVPCPSNNSPPPSPSSLAVSTARILLDRVRRRSSALSGGKTGRTLSDFYVQAEEPHQRYSPGDLVRGTVHLTVSKPIRITHLVVGLHGAAQVFKTGLSGRGGKGRPISSLAGSKQTKDRRGNDNGFRPICQEEIVLCGEGRLDAGIYEFLFELEFPTKGLPSSIDFERGTISYSISSTLTRPTTGNPTTTCDRKLHLNEIIDIGRIDVPEPRLITLGPIKRLSRSKASITQLPLRRIRSDDVGADTPRSSLAEAPNARNPRELEPPHSPALSEVSGESIVSGSTGSVRVDPGMEVRRPLQRGKENASVADKTITATVELLRGGCLPGDTLPLKITIDHVKPIKSLHGAIVTLYRQSRIELKDGSAHDGLYKGYKAGFDGRSSDSTISVYRKDLCQTFSPLIVDPRTLTAVVRTSVKLPDDIFPTISSVPDDLLSFQYYVEVVLDLNGKLAGQDGFLSHFRTMTFSSNGSQGSHPLLTGSVESMWGGSVLDTDRLQREKSVVSCVMEVIVGTMDSARCYKRRMDGQQPGRDGGPVASNRVSQVASTHGDNDDRPDPAGHPEDMDDRGHRMTQEPATSDHQIFVPIPPPEMLPEADEKTRLRQAEERLLPSQPPRHGEESSIVGPSAPAIPEGGQLESHGNLHGRFEPLAPGIETTGVVGHLDEQRHASHTDQPIIRTTDDKQELERQRLLAEASAPSDQRGDDGDEEDQRVEAGPSGSGVASQPSAPMLSEQEYDGAGSEHLDFNLVEGLPRYER